MTDAMSMRGIARSWVVVFEVESVSLAYESVLAYTYNSWILIWFVHYSEDCTGNDLNLTSLPGSDRPDLRADLLFILNAVHQPQS